MKHFFTCAVILLVLCAGCFDSFKSRDSIANGATNSCTVQAEFASGVTKLFRQEPKELAAFTARARDEVLPELTNILVSLDRNVPQTFSLNADQITKLRDAAGQELRLVVYDSGIAVISPKAKKALWRAVMRPRGDANTYWEAVRQTSDESIAFTQKALSR